MNREMRQVIQKIQNIKSVFALLVCIVLSVIGFSSCDWSFLNGGVATFASLEEEEADVFNERQIPQEAFFYVKVSDARSARRGDKFDYLMYARHEGPGVACKVPVNQESSEDLYCMLDILEGDLLFQDITLEYNVPENMCDYLEFKLPWHYNQKVDQGLREIWSVTDDDGTFYYGSDPGAASCAECESGTYNNGTCRSSTPLNCGDETASCNTNNEVICTGEGTPTCPEGTIPACSGNTPYCETGKPTCGDAPSDGQHDDKRFDCKAKGVDLKDHGLADCCFGKYTEYPYTKATNEDGIEFWKRGEGIEGEWGTDFNACIGGMARVNPTDGRQQTIYNGFITIENAPAPKVYGDNGNIREDGLDGTYRIEKIYTYTAVPDYEGYSGYRIYKSVGSASCWGDDDGPEGCETEDRSWPRAMYTNDGDLLIPTLKGHPFFTWSCLNKGLEVMHRIHLIVREWNTEDEFNAYKESNGSRGTANENGEQDGCDAYGSDTWINYESECNDLPDVKDIEGNYHGIFILDPAIPASITKDLLDYPGVRYE